jgi:hypothetical protein
MNLPALSFLEVSAADGVSQIMLSNKPVNSFSLGLRRALLSALAAARRLPIDAKAARACLATLRGEAGNTVPARRGALDALPAAVDAVDFDAGMAIAARITEDLLENLPRRSCRRQGRTDK